MYSKLRSKFHALRHYFLTVSFVVGFIIDNITLGRIDQLFGNVVLFGYVFLAGFSLFILYAAAADRVFARLRAWALEYIPFVIQFAFGGLLSGVLVFYSRSGSWYTSWPFLVILVGVILVNEFLRDRVGRFLFNLIIFFIGCFAYFALIVPVVLKKMGPEIFIISGAVTIVFFLIYLRLLRLVIPKFMAHHMRIVVFTIGMVFAGLNFLYFGNLIPPIPLALKHLGIYHEVVNRGGGTYELTYEKGPWYEFWKDSDKTYHYEPGNRIYCFASVFAPTAFDIDIYHHWEYYDEAKGEWVSRSRLPYRIEGGRDGGYRGYTFQDAAINAGLWRCTVETEQGAALGRETFTVVKGKPGQLTTSTN